MASVFVDIKKTILEWALTYADPDRIGQNMYDRVQEWINGVKRPTYRQISDFSKKVHIPLAYFFLQEPPDEEIGLIEYRTMDSIALQKPSRDLIDTIREMDMIRGWMRDYRQEAGFKKVAIAGSLKSTEGIKPMTNQIRRDMGLPIDWFRETSDIRDSFNKVRGCLERCAVIVMMNGVVGQNNNRPLNASEFRAFAIADEWAPLIFINANDSSGARLFSLVHELVHIWLGEDDLYNDQGNTNKPVKTIEKTCNAVAAEVLVPTELFLRKWDEEKTGKDLFKTVKGISDWFRCGSMVIARRALDHKRITKKMYMEITAHAVEDYKNRKKNQKDKGGNYYNTKSSRLDRSFVNALNESVRSGRITYTEAYRLSNTSMKTFPVILERMGGVKL